MKEAIERALCHCRRRGGEVMTSNAVLDANSADVKDIKLLTVHRLNSGLFVNVTDIRG
ncbi:hypothetical protein KCP69_20005 [Salmonella enterica subsp. enterica]|nr:hypothetical protein KCP69_20005 [Salmonella enterica subsp. enterica]